MILFSRTNPKVIFNFNKQADISNWTIVDDAVMGGKSSGSFKSSPDGNGIFEGTVSLENNGGFSLVRYRFPKTTTNEYTKAHLKIKGDGKTYQFRIKSNSEDSPSYVTRFSTSGEWQNIELVLNDMYPTFRGRKLDQPNFPNEHIEEIAILIGNKKNEDFKLLIDMIELR